MDIHKTDDIIIRISENNYQNRKYLDQKLDQIISYVEDRENNEVK